MQLDEKATEIVLRSLREAIPIAVAGQGRRAAVAAPRAPRHRPRRVPRRVRPRPRRRLRRQQELVRPPRGRRRARPARRARTSASLRRAVGRLLHIDDDERIATYRQLLAGADRPTVDALPERERRLVHMLVAALADQALTKDTSLQDARRPRCGPTRRCAPSCASCSACSTTGSTTSTRRSPRIPTCRCRSTPATPASRSSPRLGIGDRRQDRRLAERRLRGQGRQRRAARLHARQEQRRLLPHHPLPRLRHQPRRSSTGRASRSPEPTARPASATATTSATAARSCSSPASAPTTAPSGSSAPPPIAATSARRPMAITWELDHPLPGDLYAVVRRRGGVTEHRSLLRIAHPS